MLLTFSLSLIQRPFLTCLRRLYRYAHAQTLRTDSPQKLNSEQAQDA